jgi:hypothetical protein
MPSGTALAFVFCADFARDLWSLSAHAVFAPSLVFSGNQAA